MDFMEIRSSMTNCREQNKMDVCCSFKPLVGGQCSFDRRDRCQSIEIVPLLSCSKDITRQFKDVKSEGDLILARTAMFTVPKCQYQDDLSTISFIRWTWLDKGNREV